MPTTVIDTNHPLATLNGRKLPIITQDITTEEFQFIGNLLVAKWVQPLFMGRILRSKGSSWEERTLIVSECRIFIINTAKMAVTKEGHIFDLVELSSSSSQQFTLKFPQWEIMINSPHVDDLVAIIHRAYMVATRGIAGLDNRFNAQWNIQPESRIPHIIFPEDDPQRGFVDAFLALCNFYGTPNRQFIGKVLRNHFEDGNHTLNVKELYDGCGDKCENDFRALFTALAFCDYFTSLYVQDIPVGEGLVDMARVFAKNTALERILLANTKTREAVFAAIGTTLERNSKSALKEIAISEQKLGDEGLAAFAQGFRALVQTHPLHSLALDGCNVTAKGTAYLVSALRDPRWMTCLSKLDLSFNALGVAGSKDLATWLQSSSGLEYLALSHCSLDTDTVIEALALNTVLSREKLCFLDLSGNKIHKRAGQRLDAMVKSTTSLRMLNVSKSNLAVDCLVGIIAAVVANSSLSEFGINASHNDIGTSGAKLLAKTLNHAPKLRALILNDNGMGDEGTAEICNALCGNKVLRILALDRNVKKGKGALTGNALARVVASAKELRVLSVRGDEEACLKQELAPLFDTLPLAKSLVLLDIEGNRMGNEGAKHLGDALSKCTSLRTVRWDYNKTTAQGFESFVAGFMRNGSIANMPLPHDFKIAEREAGKGKSEALGLDISKIKEILTTNGQALSTADMESDDWDRVLRYERIIASDNGNGGSVRRNSIIDSDVGLERQRRLSDASDEMAQMAEEEIEREVRRQKEKNNRISRSPSLSPSVSSNEEEADPPKSPSSAEESDGGKLKKEKVKEWERRMKEEQKEKDRKQKEEVKEWERKVRESVKRKDTLGSQTSSGMVITHTGPENNNTPPKPKKTVGVGDANITAEVAAKVASVKKTFDHPENCEVKEISRPLSSSGPEKNGLQRYDNLHRLGVTDAARKTISEITAAADLEREIKRKDSSGISKPLPRTVFDPKEAVAAVQRRGSNAGGNESATDLRTRNSVVSQGGEVFRPDHYFTLEELRNPQCPSHIDRSKKEFYLADSEFVSVFGCTKEVWVTQQDWMTKNKKRSEGLL